MPLSLGALLNETVTGLPPAALSGYRFQPSDLVTLAKPYRVDSAGPATVVSGWKSKRLEINAEVACGPALYSVSTSMPHLSTIENLRGLTSTPTAPIQF